MIRLKSYPLEGDWDTSMPKGAVKVDENAIYRRRLRDAGDREVLFRIPEKTLAVIDDLKNRQGLHSRSMALLQLIERGMEAAQ